MRKTEQNMGMRNAEQGMGMVAEREWQNTECQTTLVALISSRDFRCSKYFPC